MFEYFKTAFKVMVGVITNEKLAIFAIVALCLLLLWVVFSLIFSYQYKFAKNARKINEYVGRKGLNKESISAMQPLIKNMPSEFQREFETYVNSEGDLPSKYIKRFESLDVELTGGVFNQNKSILKTYTNVIFVILTLFSIALLDSETALTGYMLAEALITPLWFLLIAKIIYYVYTAIRQYQYRVAVDEFNDMLDNLDATHKQKFMSVQAEPETAEPETPVAPSVNVDLDVGQLADKLKVYLDEYMLSFQDKVPSISSTTENAYEPKLTTFDDEIEEEPLLNEEPKADKQVKEPEKDAGQKEEKKKLIKEQPAEQTNGEAKEETKAETMLEKLDAPQPKRGRGRPRKEVNTAGEFTINNDKDFEEALNRAEKLMRKNEQPLSPSQTKRIEKQIKELVDAMTKYKEGK